MLVSSEEYNTRRDVAADYISEIRNIPTGTITSADYQKVQNYEPLRLEYEMKNNCNSRTFDELLGYVDLQIHGQKDLETKKYEPLTLQKIQHTKME